MAIPAARAAGSGQGSGSLKNTIKPSPAKCSTVALISEFQATVEHFAGDGLMVFFNDPLPCPDPAARAAGMAIAMRDRMAELSATWRRRGCELGFGVGVAFGYATLGVIGFEG